MTSAGRIAALREWLISRVMRESANSSTNERFLAEVGSEYLRIDGPGLLRQLQQWIDQRIDQTTARSLTETQILALRRVRRHLLRARDPLTGDQLIDEALTLDVQRAALGETTVYRRAERQLGSGVGLALFEPMLVTMGGSVVPGSLTLDEMVSEWRRQASEMSNHNYGDSAYYARQLQWLLLKAPDEPALRAWLEVLHPFPKLRRAIALKVYSLRWLQWEPTQPHWPGVWPEVTSARRLEQVVNGLSLSPMYARESMDRVWTLMMAGQTEWARALWQLQRRWSAPDDFAELDWQVQLVLRIIDPSVGDVGQLLADPQWRLAARLGSTQSSSLAEVHWAVVRAIMMNDDSEQLLRAVWPDWEVQAVRLPALVMEFTDFDRYGDDEDEDLVVRGPLEWLFTRQRVPADGVFPPAEVFEVMDMLSEAWDEESWVNDELVDLWTHHPRVVETLTGTECGRQWLVRHLDVHVNDADDGPLRLDIRESEQRRARARALMRVHAEQAANDTELRHAEVRQADEAASRYPQCRNIIDHFTRDEWTVEHAPELVLLEPGGTAGPCYERASLLQYLPTTAEWVQLARNESERCFRTAERHLLDAAALQLLRTTPDIRTYQMRVTGETEAAENVHTLIAVGTQSGLQAEQAALREVSREQRQQVVVAASAQAEGRQARDDADTARFPHCMNTASFITFDEFQPGADVVMLVTSTSGALDRHQCYLRTEFLDHVTINREAHYVRTGPLASQHERAFLHRSPVHGWLLQPEAVQLVRDSPTVHRYLGVVVAETTALVPVPIYNLVALPDLPPPTAALGVGLNARAAVPQHQSGRRRHARLPLVS